MRDEFFFLVRAKKKKRKKGPLIPGLLLISKLFPVLGRSSPPHPMLANPVVMNVVFFSVHCTWFNIGWKSDNFKISGSCCVFVWAHVHALSVKRMRRLGGQEAGRVMGAGAAKCFLPLCRGKHDIAEHKCIVFVWTRNLPPLQKKA